MRRVIRFNWPKLVGGVLLALVCFVFGAVGLDGLARLAVLMVGAGSLYFVVASLVATWWVYDRGDIEQLRWLIESHGTVAGAVASVHVGYDDLRSGLEHASGNNDVTGLYYPVDGASTPWHGHSLERAIQHDDRRSELQLADAVAEGLTFDFIVFGFAAHELRSEAQRQDALGMAAALLSEGGELVVIEHMRDVANLAVYGPGAWHFLTSDTWRSDFDQLRLSVKDSYRFGVLVRAFVLQPTRVTNDSLA